MKKLTRDELFAMFDKEVHNILTERLNRPDVTGMVVFVNQDMCSSQLGQSTALIVGPNCTYKSWQETEGKWLNDLPSQRQYAEAYYEKGSDT
jgi:hypothetical protein